ncbi:alpha/beta fold hydrolase [Gephyromycinifex aptenodytis]|uniref:alpha/beta fold hydrolase n=1 Tax=Gephyromycinifex aptenodytis TaxID=2716227 RepID=UPI001446F1BB
MVDSVVFLHGLGGSPLSWEAQTAALPANLQANAPWLHGLRPGRSGQNETFTLEAAARQVATTVEFDQGGHAALVGHSLGALVALRCALDRPELVDRLVLLGATADPPRSAMWLQSLLIRLLPKTGSAGWTKNAYALPSRKPDAQACRSTSGMCWPPPWCW